MCKLKGVRVRINGVANESPGAFAGGGNSHLSIDLRALSALKCSWNKLRGGQKISGKSPDALGRVGVVFIGNFGCQVLSEISLYLLSSSVSYVKEQLRN